MEVERLIFCVVILNGGVELSNCCIIMSACCLIVFMVDSCVVGLKDYANLFNKWYYYVYLPSKFVRRPCRLVEYLCCWVKKQSYYVCMLRCCVHRLCLLIQYSFRLVKKPSLLVKTGKPLCLYTMLLYLQNMMTGRIFVSLG